MKEVIYSKNGGMGIILDINENENDFIDKVEIKIVDTILVPGQLTDLFGMFKTPIRYVGLQKNVDTKNMVFHTGDSGDLFSQNKYYYCFIWLSKTRIFNCYKYGTARDFNWVKGKWK